MTEAPTRVRRAARDAAIAIVASGQVICAVELAGARLGPPALVLALTGAVALAVAVRALRRPASDEPRELAVWPLIGLAAWLAWGGLYYGAAAITAPESARVFDDFVLEAMPLLPAFAPVYVGVQAFSLIPYCVLPEPRLLRRYALGNLLLLAACAIAWVSVPVKLEHTVAVDGIPGFGAWLLRFVYANDRTTNCFPSAQTALALYAAVALRVVSRRLFWWGMATAAAVSIGVMFVKQHYLADVAMGNMLAAILAWAIARPTPERHANGLGGGPRAR